MQNFKKHLTAGLTVALIWAFTWAILTVLVGTVLNWLMDFSLEKHIDPMAAMAMPGFILGLIFFAIISLTNKLLDLHEISAGKLSLIGLGVGIFTGVAVPFMGSPNPEYAPVHVYLSVIGVTGLLSTISAQSTYWVLRLLKKV